MAYRGGLLGLLCVSGVEARDGAGHPGSPRGNHLAPGSLGIAPHRPLLAQVLVGSAVRHWGEALPFISIGQDVEAPFDIQVTVWGLAGLIYLHTQA